MPEPKKIFDLFEGSGFAATPKDGKGRKLYFTRLYFSRVATSFARCSAERGKSGRRISSSTLPMSARAVFTGMGLVTENMA